MSDWDKLQLALKKGEKVDPFTVHFMDMKHKKETEVVKFDQEPIDYSRYKPLMIGKFKASQIPIAMHVITIVDIFLILLVTCCPGCCGPVFSNKIVAHLILVCLLVMIGIYVYDGAELN